MPPGLGPGRAELQRIGPRGGRCSRPGGVASPPCLGDDPAAEGDGPWAARPAPGWRRPSRRSGCAGAARRDRPAGRPRGRHRPATGARAPRSSPATAALQQPSRHVCEVAVRARALGSMPLSASPAASNQTRQSGLSAVPLTSSCSSVWCRRSSGARSGRGPSQKPRGANRQDLSSPSSASRPAAPDSRRPRSGCRRRSRRAPGPLGGRRRRPARRCRDAGRESGPGAAAAISRRRRSAPRRAGGPPASAWRRRRAAASSRSKASRAGGSRLRPGLGQRQGTVEPAEQRHAQVRLQRLDLVADGGLGHGQLLRRLG